MGKKGEQMPEAISLHLQPRNECAGSFLYKQGLGNKLKKPFSGLPTVARGCLLSWDAGVPGRDLAVF